MGPKSKKQGASDKSKDVQDTEDPLQALVFVDSFETKFVPFTTERPRCLLPLVNVPLIEYTLEFLALNEVEEVILYCGMHTEKVNEYLQGSKWTQESSPFRVETIRSTSRSIGDAMRDLDKRAILGGDFIVVYGDVVSNLPLGKALAEHKARRAVDKNAIMTMALREAGSLHRSKAQEVLSTFVLDVDKDRCLQYAQIDPDSSSSNLELEPDTLSGHANVDIRTDLIDCGIDICTPDVLALWTDNFDYEHPRRGFLHSVLKDYELNGKTIHTHIFDERYAARVRNLQAYDAVSKDVIFRWTYPITPDSNMHADDSCVYRKRDIYRGHSSGSRKLHGLGRGSVIGKQTKIGEGTTISRSVLGRDCVIEKNCKIEDSYIWDAVTIKERSIIRNSIVGHDAVIHEGAQVLSGSLVSFGAVLPAHTIVTNGQHVVHVPNQNVTDDHEKDVFSADDTRDQKTRLASSHSISTLRSEDLDDGGGFDISSHHRSSVTSLTSDDSHAAQASKGFLTEASGSIYDSLKQKHDVANIQLELQALRMSSNASEHEVRKAVVSGLVKFAVEARKEGTGLKQVLASNKTLVEKTIFDEGEGQPRDQVDFLLLAQNELCKYTDGDTTLAAICNDLYLMDDFEEDLFEAEAFQEWWKDERATANDALRQVRNKCQKFMEVLEENEDEEDEDDTGSDSE
ncbi:MAG: hypothetical protein M1828_006848 [Chrysothrix sp. TS-e1954]|nr:MAG: hypothetical protein M1828_006848 [Chrysothrix sp. TS-e1954]